MARISIIVPVYNKEKYLRKCLDSIFAQESDFDVIIINDGSTDGSQRIIDEYSKKHDKIKAYQNENRGVAYSRNIGIDKAKSEYFMFIDADDYVKPDLIGTLVEALNKNPDVDLFSFSMIKVDTKGHETECTKKPHFNVISGEEAIRKFITAAKTFDTPVAYLYKKDYWTQNDFKYAENRYHEDFGLIPLVILKAGSVISLDYVGYYYVQSDNSIMRTTDNKKTIKKAYDFLYHFDFLLSESKKSDITKQAHDTFNIYLVYSIILKSLTLDKPQQKQFLGEIKKRKVYKLWPNNSIKATINKLLIRISVRMYIKFHRLLKK